MQRHQTALAIWFLGVVAGTTAAIDGAARSTTLALWMDAEREGRVRDARIVYEHNGFFDYLGDQFLLEELPGADYSQGGVYLVGASNLAWSTSFWKLPPEQQALIHNYAIGGVYHTLEFHFIRYLVEHAGFLGVGGDKTLVIFGASYHNAASDGGTDVYFINLWKRHGFYDCDLEGGIRPAPVHPLLRWIRTERARMPGFLKMTKDLAIVQIKRALRIDASLPLRCHEPERYKAVLRKIMGARWKENVREQIAEFDRLIDYLRDQDVRVEVVLLPLASWDDELPYKAVYNADLTNLCDSKGIPLHDWSRMLEDDEFADYAHPNVFGMEKLTRAFVGIALPHLRRTGALHQADRSARQRVRI